MIKEIKLIYIRFFKILTKNEALEIGLTPYKNIYGDNINHLNCRSIWVDSKNRKYRVKELVNML